MIHLRPQQLQPCHGVSFGNITFVPDLIPSPALCWPILGSSAAQTQLTAVMWGPNVIFPCCPWNGFSLPAMSASTEPPPHPPTVPSMYRHNVPVLVSTAHLQINWIFYFLFCTAPQCPLSPLPLWPFPSRFPISCVPCSTITQLLTDGVQAAEWDVIDISVLLASLRLLFRYWRVCLPAVCLLHLDGAAY